MRLNNFSHVHKRIRKLCYYIETVTGLKLVNSLDDEFTTLLFCNALSYIRIEYDLNAYATLNYRLCKKDIEIIEEIIILLRWLDIGGRINETYTKQSNVS